MKKRGFTAIEILIVMSIILILAGLTMAVGPEIRRRALATKARASISLIETGIGMFQADIGAYPASGNANLVTCLTAVNGCLVGTDGHTITTSEAENWSGPYMNFQQNELDGGQFIDPWGRPYLYTNPGSDHGTGVDYISYVDIWSLGPDGVDQHTLTPPGDDIVNWRR